MSDFDVIVVGSGAGGGVAARVFAERGKRVLILERGHAYPPGWTGRDTLRNHRYSPYGHNTGPDVEGNPRVFVDPSGVEHLVKPYEGGYQNNAMGVGGGTRVYAAQSWRFHPLDFRMASTYGVPAGSSLANWPIDYEELAPYYEKLEWGVGVCGGPPAANMPPRRDYPMPAMALGKRGARLSAAAEKLGWAHQRIPMLINSIPYNGRPACIGCQFCVGFGCPVDAKNGSQNTTIPKALAHPGCELWTEARVTRLRTDAAGKVTGVVVMRGGEALEVSAEVVVLAAGAIETARLLLLSPTPRDPKGIGNNSDLVGRNLQGHYYPGAQGMFDEEVNDPVGPGPTTSVTHFNHGNQGIVGGGMLADDSIPLPVSFASSWVHPDVPKYGKELKEWVRKRLSKELPHLRPGSRHPESGGSGFSRSSRDGRSRNSGSTSQRNHPPRYGQNRPLHTRESRSRLATRSRREKMFGSTA